jgi:type IV secretory pathway TraG/TraD family ATPase VirD4
MPSPGSPLPKYHPATIIRADPDTGWQFTIADAQTGVACFGATGSGKTSGTGKHLAWGYLGSAAEMGFLVLAAKKDEAEQWRKWAEETNRSKDLIMFDASGEHFRFNFLDWELSRASEGGGLTINVVALLEEIILALQPERTGGSGENVFWEDALHNLLVNAVELVKLAGSKYPLRLEYMRDIVRSAPISREQAKDPKWQEDSPCWFFLQEAARTTAGGDEELKADYQECRSYWLDDFANLSDRTRSVITLMFTKLAQPFTAKPLRKLFSTDTTVRPEDTFDGKIIVINIPTQEYFLVGKIAAITWKYCTQMAIMHRALPTKPDEYLRPVCIWADEAAENFLSRGDSAFQAVARASGGCTVYLSQNINQYRKRLGDNDAFESFISNLQTKFFHQVTGPTATWASELLGQRYEKVPSITGGGTTPQAQDGYASTHGSATFSEQRRYFVEPSRFTTLKRGGIAYNYEVEAICYKGGHVFGCGCNGAHDPQKCQGKPYIALTFNQRK